MAKARRARASLRAAFGCAAMIALASSTQPARAEPSPQELAAARATFTEGKELEKAGDWAGALEKFKTVAEVKVTPQVRFHIALCEENLGKLVSAIKGFELAAEDAKLAGSSAIEVAENAPRRAEALKKRVAHLRIDVAGQLVTSKLTLDGIEVLRDKIGQEQLVDPGPHVVALDTNGETAFKKELVLAEHADEAVSVEVHDAAGPVVSPGDNGAVAASTLPGGPRLPAYIVGGVGAVGGITSAVLMGVSQHDASLVEAHCKAKGSVFVCPTKVEGTGSSGESLYNTSLVVGGLGIAAIATGAVLFFVLAPKKAKPAAVGPRVVVSPTRDGVRFAF